MNAGDVGVSQPPNVQVGPRGRNEFGNAKPDPTPSLSEKHVGRRKSQHVSTRSPFSRVGRRASWKKKKKRVIGLGTLKSGEREEPSVSALCPHWRLTYENSIAQLLPWGPSIPRLATRASSSYVSGPKSPLWLSYPRRKIRGLVPLWGTCARGNIQHSLPRDAWIADD